MILFLDTPGTGGGGAIPTPELVEINDGVIAVQIRDTPAVIIRDNTFMVNVMANGLPIVIQNPPLEIELD